MRPSFLVILLLLVSGASFAQLTRKEKKAARRNEAVDQPTTLDPANSQPDYSSKHAKQTKAKKKGTGPTYNSQKEFENRMDARAKTYRKNEKNVSTPQYVDPMYFGHKKPPKKRPAHKMKLCKVCGIRH
jgi:hypothetical protein